MAIKWTDRTGYSRGDEERVPSVWECSPVDGLRVVVHRHINYDPDQWLLSCPSMAFTNFVLGPKDAEFAQKEALALLLERAKLCAAALREALK